MLADITDGFSGADIKGLIEHTKNYAIERTLESGDVSLISTEDFLSAMVGRTPSTTHKLMKESVKFRENRQLKK